MTDNNIVSNDRKLTVKMTAAVIRTAIEAIDWRIMGADDGNPETGRNLDAARAALLHALKTGQSKEIS